MFKVVKHVLNPFSYIINQHCSMIWYRYNAYLVCIFYSLRTKITLYVTYNDRFIVN